MKSAWSDDDLTVAVQNSTNYKQVYQTLGLSGRSLRALQRVGELGLSTAHFTSFDRGRKWTDEELTLAVAECFNGTQVSLRLGLAGHQQTIKRHIAKLGLDTSHWLNGKRPGVSGYHTPLDQILIADSDYSTARLKTRLVEGAILEDRCVGCGLLPEWNGQPITLQLDHIDGNHRNHLIENLRILCPNCHTQTPTFGSKNRRR